MAKAAVFTLKIEPDLRAEFMAAAEANHRPASQVVRELMREFIRQQQQRSEHTAFLQQKVDVARTSIGAGLGRPNDAVEAEFSARRTRLADDL